MKRLAIIALMGFLLSHAAAQDSPIVFDDLTVTTQIDVYGIEAQVLRGTMTNTSDDALTDITLMGDVLNADEAVIGEVFGYRVNACDVALLDDPLQPNETAPFALPLELYGELTGADAIPATFDLSASSTPTAAEAPSQAADVAGIVQIASEEIVAVEWTASDVLLFGAGCDEAIFSTYQWSRYDVESARTTRLTMNPNATFLTDELIDGTAVTIPSIDASQQDTTLLDRSFLSFIPNTTRLVWQNDKHDLYTADRDGAINRREVHTFLHQYSLRGFVFTPDSNLLAYYFGAYGEPVRYLTSSANGVLTSQVITVNPVSNTVPGVQYDGRRVIISGTFDGVTGYYFQSAQTPQKELLFEIDEADLAGNHYPAPAYFRRDEDTRLIYVIRPIDGQATLQCYHYEGKTLRTLTALPLQLMTDERAWSWLSPDGTHLAVAANGRHGGLWLVNLDEFEPCSPAAD